MVEILRARRGPITLVGIKIEPEEPFVLVGETKQLTARAKPKAANRGAITWSGGSSTTVSVDENGVITGQKAESRVSVTARSDAGFTDWAYARCGYDVTDIAFEADTLTIEGIQGVLFDLTPTPSNATEISYTSVSDDGSIAGYYISNTASERRMWGYGVGSAVVTAMGRSGRTETSCRVTVTPVDVEGVEIRDGYSSVYTTTDEGDSIPPIVPRVSIFVGQKWGMKIYYTPYNTTNRLLSGTFDTQDVAGLELLNGAETYYDRKYGTARYETAYVTGESKGVTNLTIEPRNGDSASVEINVFNPGELYGSGKFTALSGGTGRFDFTVSGKIGFIPNVIFAEDNNLVQNNWTYLYSSPYSVSLFRQDGSKRGYPSGYLAVRLSNGNLVRITSTISGTI